MPYASEGHFESRIRDLIAAYVTKPHPHIYALKNKKAVDIVVCKDGPSPELFFIEVKYHKPNHGRLGFGGGKGGGFQPEILTRQPHYFEKNLRWALAHEAHPDKALFLRSSVMREYVCGGEIGDKFNNIQQRVFREQTWLTEQELARELVGWLGGASDA